jgi:hypothetical protein
MTQSPVEQLSPFQQTILDVVLKYSGQFSSSGLAKMLVGARSWQDANHPEYGRFARHGRKGITYQVDILLQQGFLQLDGREHLITVPAARRQEVPDRNDA